MTRRAIVLFLLWIIAVIVLIWYFATVAAYGQTVWNRTNWYFFAATAVDLTGLESVYSNEASTSRYWGNYWRSVTLAWDPSADYDVIGYNIYWGTNSGHYTHSNGIFVGTIATIQVFPPPLTNRVIRITTSSATNLLAATFLAGPWVLMNRTNVQLTNPHTSQYWRAVGKTRPTLTQTNWWQ